MVQVTVLMVTIFVGWLLLDFTKHKKLTKENVLSALISGFIAGAVYYFLFGLF
ncbi:hypothetical protein [Anaerobacillus alkalidiazotrophicus]|uniref:hypothetical protein n=1 Tax=Anaerobacillus alkalidiazotrophicus TaxID=472963 RepID=UPI0014712605|nr:hypothetical protein [Anaerobacillus alkalidiazotrophicus]